MAQLKIQTNNLLTGTATAAQVTPQHQQKAIPAQATQITKGMKERAELAKQYIEGKYSKRASEENQRKDAWEMLE